MKTKDDFESALLGYTTSVLIDGDFKEDTFNFWCERLKEIAHKQFEIEAKVKSICLAQDYKLLDRNGERTMTSKDTENQNRKNKTCRTCKHRQRCECESKTIQYCGVRKSNRTFNHLLKIKETNEACSLYKEEQQ